LKWPFPEDLKALQSLLGVVNYLRQHISRLSSIEEPLNKARASEEAFEREINTNREAMVESFQILKQAIASAPLLRYPDPKRPFHVSPDASKLGLGAVLYQTTPEQDEVGDTSIQADNIVMISSQPMSDVTRFIS